MKHHKQILVFLVIFLTLFTACPTQFDGPLLKDARVIRFDVQNLLFANSLIPNSEYEEGLGAETLNITIETSNDSYEIILAKADISESQYSIVQQEVSGVLKSITLTAVCLLDGERETLRLSVNSLTQPEGTAEWETFENLVKFRVSMQRNLAKLAESRLILDAAPRGGAGLSLLWDSSATVADVHRNFRTDREADIVSRQIAIQPQWLENPKDLEYEVYLLVLNENLQAKTDSSLSGEAEYLFDPWQHSWSVHEIETSGRSIGGEVYQLQKLRLGMKSQFIAEDPLEDGKGSFLLDLNELDFSDGVYGAEDGNYALIAFVIQHLPRDSTLLLKTTSQIICVKID